MTLPLSQQVCSLELAKKLAAVGVPQDSFFVWYGGTTPATLWTRDRFEEKRWNHPEQTYAAFTVAELGEMLPYTAFGAYFNEFKGKDDWSMAYGREKTIVADTEADARASLLIYLIESHLIDPKTLKV